MVERQTHNAVNVATSVFGGSSPSRRTKIMEDFSFGIIPIHTETKNVLLVESTSHEWGLPKGHKEPNDRTDEECALRELAEETGISECLLVADRRYEISYRINRDGIDCKKTVCFFPGFIKGFETHPAPDEILTASWFSYTEALKKVSFDDVRLVLEKAYSDLDLQ